MGVASEGQWVWSVSEVPWVWPVCVELIMGVASECGVVWGSMGVPSKFIVPVRWNMVYWSAIFKSTSVEKWLNCMYVEFLVSTSIHVVIRDFTFSY